MSLRDVDLTEAGLTGDRYAGRDGKRAVTLIQAEHLPVIADLSARDAFAPDLLRRNLVVSAINLLALKDLKVSIGTAVVEFTSPCHPCSKMETALGPGGYNAMRGHGGWCARVIETGHIQVGDQVCPA